MKQINREPIDSKLRQWGLQHPKSKIKNHTSQAVEILYQPAPTFKVKSEMQPFNYKWIFLDFCFFFLVLSRFPSEVSCTSSVREIKKGVLHSLTEHRNKRMHVPQEERKKVIAHDRVSEHSTNILVY